MSKHTTAAAVAKVATAAAKSNKVNAKSSAAVGISKMDAAKIAAAAKDAADGCKTCGQVAAKFGALVAKFGKENAVAIQTAAKEIVKGRNEETAAAATDARNFLNDGGRVAAAAWRELLNEDRQGAIFARIVFDKCGRNLAAVVSEFSTLAAVVDGCKIAAVRCATKDGNGNIVVTYKPRNLAAVGGYLAALKQSINNAKRAALGGFEQKIVVIK